MLVSDVLWALVGGSVIGVVGSRLSGDRVPVWLTALAGIGGVVLGNLAYIAVFLSANPGIDWWRHTWQVLGAALLVALAAILWRRVGSRSG